MDNFPPEIMTIVLSTLPVKSIFRCRAVCKTWCSIIDNPQFPQVHFNSSKSQSTNASSLIFLHQLYDDIYTAKEDEFLPRNLIISKVDISLNRRTWRFAQPPVNGLLFMYSYLNHHSSSGINCSMYICNPATRHCVKLPNYNPLLCRQATFVRGFGFDKIGSQFKVVQISNGVGGQSGMDSEVQVYTLGSNSWRNIVKAPDVSIFRHISASTNGSLHWLTIYESKDGVNSSFSIGVLSFDLGVEEFAVVPTPEIYHYINEIDLPDPEQFDIMALGECLSVVNSLFEDHIEIWILKEYNVKESWTRYSVSKYYMDRVQFTVVQPISLLKNSEIVLLYGFSKLVSYDFVSECFTPLTVDGLPGYSPLYGISPGFYQVCAYVESLFSIRSTVE